MKPLRLTMEAFGPYAKTTTLDFQALHGKPLVLIHGPTGGGKTAILDAMCFGLFGKTSGDERQGSDLRSDLAEDAQLTRVTFDFLHGERVLRVMREPTQQKKKSRGDGFTEHKTQAWLWDQSAVSPEDHCTEGLLLAEKPKAVDAEVKSILGFTEEQFRQIVVLPQGKFRDFLSAPAKDKEKILKTLFGTAIYESITDELQKETRALEATFAANESRRKGILEERGLTSIDELNEAISTLATAIPSLTEQASARAQEAQGAAAALLKAQEQNKQVEARMSAEQRLKALDDKQPTIKALEARLSKVQALKPLRPVAESLESARQASIQAKDANNEAQKRKTQADSRAQDAKNARLHEESDEVRATREGHEKAVNVLASLQNDVQAYAGVKAKHLRADQTLKEAKEDEEKALSLLERSRAKFSKLEAEASTLGKYEVALVKAREAVTKHRELGKALDGLWTRRSSIESAQKRRAAAEQAEKAASQAHLESVEAFKTLRLQWHQGQAARLASELKFDSPCPVCGSKDHPAPAQVKTDGIPTDEALEAAERQCDAKRSALDEARQALTTEKSNLTSLNAQLQEQAEALGQDATLTSDDLKERGLELEETATSLARQVETATEANQSLELGKTKMPGIESAAAAAVEARQKAELALEKFKTELASLENRIPESLRDLQTFQTALRAEETARDTARNRYEKAKNDEQAAEKAQIAASTEAQNTTKQLEEAQKSLNTLTTQLRDARKEADLEDEAVYKQALEDSETESDIETTVKTYYETLNGARGELKQAQATVGASQLQDLDIPTRISEEALAASQAKTKELHDTQANHQALLSARESYERLVEAGGKDAERYQAIASLSEAAAGKNARRLSLQRYVLASLLDDVLAHASERLRMMSTGRYRVLRDEALRDARQAGGLDLLIEDQYTGESRPISTLSGGESFQAALALSLGLADVIQALSGGIRVDALFIDEGFGTLDGEALERAIAELLKLRDGGRLVGIISHVKDLRHRISARIEVSKNQHGSSISVHPGD